MNKSLRTIVRVPLIGLNVAWFVFMAAIYLGNYENGNGSGVTVGSEYRFSGYLILGAIAVFAAGASLAHSWADRMRLEKDSATSVSVFRFASLAVIIALVAGAVFALGTFMGSFNAFMSGPTSVWVRVVNVYLPIVLATALVVVVMLRATVYRKSAAHERGESGKMSATQRALIFGYVSPVVGTALAIILGMIFYDAQGRSLDVWAWVVIQAIIGASVVVGTRFASAAKAGVAVVKPAKKTVAGAVGAVNLNLVLTVIFGGVVTLMAFGMGADAVSVLGQNGEYVDGNWVARVVSVSWPWFFDKFLPAYLLLVSASVGVCLSVISRLGIGSKND